MACNPTDLLISQTVPPKYTLNLVAYVGGEDSILEKAMADVLNNRIAEKHSRGFQYTLNGSAAYLIDEANENDIISNATALSNGRAYHAEVQVLIEIIKKMRGGYNKNKESNDDFILRNKDIFNNYHIILFTERAPCEYRKSDDGERFCHDLLNELSKMNIKISVFYVVPRAVSEQGIRSPDNETVTLGMLLPEAIDFLLYQNEPPPQKLTQCVKAKISYLNNAPAEIEFFDKKPHEQANTCGLRVCKILLSGIGSASINTNDICTEIHSKPRHKLDIMALEKKVIENNIQGSKKREKTEEVKYLSDDKKSNEEAELLKEPLVPQYKQLVLEPTRPINSNSAGVKLPVSSLSENSVKRTGLKNEGMLEKGEKFKAQRIPESVEKQENEKKIRQENLVTSRNEEFSKNLLFNKLATAISSDKIDSVIDLVRKLDIREINSDISKAISEIPNVGSRDSMRLRIELMIINKNINQKGCA